MSKELRRRLQAVDPHLTIVGGGYHFKSKKSEEEWEKAAGIICSNCGREVWRSRDGLCMECWEQAHEIELRDDTGITNWIPMDIINMIARPSRKEK